MGLLLLAPFPSRSENSRETQEGTPEMEVSKADLIALKQCNDVVFRYINGTSTIEAIKRQSDTNPFEQIHIIECNTSTVIYGYNYDGMYNYDYEIENAFEMNHASRCDSVWSTVVSLLKTGDELTLFWKAGAGNNGCTKKSGLHCDHLELIIHRKAKYMSFLIECSVSENNSARMCKVARKKSQ
jgi:hypothetical protein